jgi:hypothetical protein
MPAGRVAHVAARRRRAEVVVEALRTYRETWQEGAMKSLTGDLQVSPEQAADVLGRIAALLERLPKRGVAL